jgi:hypothetical protein
MQSRSNTPQQHATRHPHHHPIFPAQSRAGRLQRDEESEEEDDGGIEIFLAQTDIARKMCALCISNLESNGQRE